MKRLYVQIYLTIVVSLLLFALLAGVFWRSAAERAGHEEFAGLATDVIESILPPAAAPASAQEAALVHWGARLQARVTLYDQGGRRIAAVGAPLALSDAGTHRRGRVWAFSLADGRTLVGVREREHRRPFVAGFVFMLFALALAVAVGAYPVVRRLTRRLERLQRGVEALGAGDLKTRVEVEGRDEVAQLAAQFNRSAARIESLVGAHRSLLAHASHELRSPLARIRVALELPVPPREELARNIAELDLLIDEILLASRLDAVRDPLPDVDVDLLAIAAEEAARFDSEAQGDAVLVRGDARLLGRMVRNLLENARRHAPGSPIEAAVRRLPGTAEIEVADRGPGVPESERERIFEPFYRPPGTREGARGHGLGLALVRQIAHRHGGSVVCLPRDAGGSRFVVSLPVPGQGGYAGIPNK